MMSFAHGRLSGLALHGPALFFLMMLSSLLLSACRQPGAEHWYQGVSLGTGYHITLYADLEPERLAEIGAGIQGELASLELQRTAYRRISGAAFRRWWQSPPAAWQHEVDRRFHALAVDRLTTWLDRYLDVPSSVLVEVGGIMRGSGSEPVAGWRLSLDQAGLPGADGARHVRLKDAALVHRFAQQEAAPLVSPATPLSVSVIAESASAAMHQASQLIHAGPNEALGQAQALDSAARVVVKTSQSIEIHHTAALEPWLEP
nr:hypothetical protein [Halomonas sp.]